MTITVKEIMQSMESPHWVQNIEYIRKITEEMNNVSTKMENTIRSVKETGVFESAKDMYCRVTHRGATSCEMPKMYTR